ncbi:hypothetical protein N1851_030514 [Merluccius polli]|uniref:Uncharacterized protein n=1 Tax=Merluccius polli TaxID=89951 RepID=A0AA47M5B6_MERPO|nr:hypothetical protein N1851_030514 [Merluccius polli]
MIKPRIGWTLQGPSQDCLLMYTLSTCQPLCKEHGQPAPNPATAAGRCLAKSPEQAVKILKLEQTGYATKLNQEAVSQTNEAWYIPHHMYKGENLNELMLPGPMLGPSLLAVLLRFCEDRVALSSDITRTRPPLSWCVIAARVAGSVLCNHCVALLYQSAHYPQVKIPVVPPVLRCTEGEQQWHKPRTLGVKPGRVEKMAVMSAKPKQRTMAEGVRSTSNKGISGELLDMSVLKVPEIYKDFTPIFAPMICTMGITCKVPLVDSR